jgi:hypothetical protein
VLLVWHEFQSRFRGNCGPLLQSAEPSGERLRKPRKVDTAEVGRIPRQITSRAPQQRLRAHVIARRMVMKGDGNLDQALNESFFSGGVDGPPDVFPDLMSFEKLSAIEVPDSLPETL